MNAIFKYVRLPILVLLVALGGAAGAAFGMVWGRYYEASLELPLTNPFTNPSPLEISSSNPAAGSAFQVFNDAEPTLRSPLALEAFLRRRGIADDPEMRRWIGDVQRGKPRVQIEHRFEISRQVLRELPDELAKTVSKDANAFSVAISAKASAPGAAVQLADTAVAFVRGILVERTLKRSADEWEHSQRSLAELDAYLLGKREGIASLERSIAALNSLRQTYPAENSSGAASSSPVQVQVSGSTFLPISQQITGLESTRISDGEEVRRGEDRSVYLKAIGAFGRALRTILSEQPDPIAALELAEKEAQNLRQHATNTPEKQAADTELSRLASIRLAFVSRETNPTSAVASAGGFGPAKAALVGVVVGVIGWLIVLYIHLSWAPQIRSRDSGIASRTSEKKIGYAPP